MSPPASSDRLRPRRRASQTHFFRYQQAANPLRAEGEDLKKALIASLQDGSKKKKGAGMTVQETNTAKTTKAKKYAALRKFASNQTRPKATASPSKNCPTNQTHDRTPEYFPKTYKPDTEDFLNFLCVRLPPPRFGNFEYSTLAAAITAHARGDYFNRLSSKITNDNLKKDIKSGSLADEMNNIDQVKGGLAVDKYLIKGLMTSEFAGAFADEETLFDLVTTTDTK